jgi:hypothetical protein
VPRSASRRFRASAADPDRPGPANRIPSIAYKRMIYSIYA